VTLPKAGFKTCVKLSVTYRIMFMIVQKNKIRNLKVNNLNRNHLSKTKNFKSQSRLLDIVERIKLYIMIFYDGFRSLLNWENKFV